MDIAEAVEVDAENVSPLAPTSLQAAAPATVAPPFACPPAAIPKTVTFESILPTAEWRPLHTEAQTGASNETVKSQRLSGSVGHVAPSAGTTMVASRQQVRHACGTSVECATLLLETPHYAAAYAPPPPCLPTTLSRSPCSHVEAGGGGGSPAVAQPDEVDVEDDAQSIRSQVHNQPGRASAYSYPAPAASSSSLTIDAFVAAQARIRELETEVLHLSRQLHMSAPTGTSVPPVHSMAHAMTASMVSPSHSPTPSVLSSAGGSVRSAPRWGAAHAGGAQSASPSGWVATHRVSRAGSAAGYPASLNSSVSGMGPSYTMPPPAPLLPSPSPVGSVLTAGGRRISSKRPSGSSMGGVSGTPVSTTPQIILSPSGPQGGRGLHGGMGNSGICGLSASTTGGSIVCLPMNFLDPDLAPYVVGITSSTWIAHTPPPPPRFADPSASNQSRQVLPAGSQDPVHQSGHQLGTLQLVPCSVVEHRFVMFVAPPRPKGSVAVTVFCTTDGSLRRYAPSVWMEYRQPELSRTVLSYHAVNQLTQDVPLPSSATIADPSEVATGTDFKSDVGIDDEVDDDEVDDDDEDDPDEHEEVMDEDDEMEDVRSASMGGDDDTVSVTTSCTVATTRTTTEQLAASTRDVSPSQTLRSAAVPHLFPSASLHATTTTRGGRVIHLSRRDLTALGLSGSCSVPDGEFLAASRGHTSRHATEGVMPRMASLQHGKTNRATFLQKHASGPRRSSHPSGAPVNHAITNHGHHTTRGSVSADVAEFPSLSGTSVDMGDGSSAYFMASVNASPSSFPRHLPLTRELLEMFEPLRSPPGAPAATGNPAVPIERSALSESSFVEGTEDQPQSSLAMGPPRHAASIEDVSVLDGARQGSVASHDVEERHSDLTTTMTVGQVLPPPLQRSGGIVTASSGAAAHYLSYRSLGAREMERHEGDAARALIIGPTITGSWTANEDDEDETFPPAAGSSSTHDATTEEVASHHHTIPHDDDISSLSSY